MGGCWVLCLSIYFLNQGNNGHISLSSSVVRGLRTPLLRRNYDVGCRHTVGSNANASCEYSNPFILNRLILFRYVKWALKPIHTVIRSRGRWGGGAGGTPWIVQHLRSTYKDKQAFILVSMFNIMCSVDQTLCVCGLWDVAGVSEDNLMHALSKTGNKNPAIQHLNLLGYTVLVQ